LSQISNRGVTSSARYRYTTKQATLTAQVPLKRFKIAKGVPRSVSSIRSGLQQLLIPVSRHCKQSALADDKPSGNLPLLRQKIAVPKAKLNLTEHSKGNVTKSRCKCHIIRILLGGSAFRQARGFPF